MSHRATCRDCEWSGDADTLSGAAREADEHRQETGHDAKVERDLATDGGVDPASPGSMEFEPLSSDVALLAAAVMYEGADRDRVETAIRESLELLVDDREDLDENFLANLEAVAPHLTDAAEKLRTYQRRAAERED